MSDAGEIKRRSNGRRCAQNTLANRAELSQFRSATEFAGLFVVLVLTEFFLQATTFEQFLETTKGGTNGLAIVYTHSDGHTPVLSTSPAFGVGLRPC